MTEAVESALAWVSFLAPLRPDEIGRVAKRFERITLQPGMQFDFPSDIPLARLIIVATGAIDIVVDDPTGEVRGRMRAGDRFGEAELLSGMPRKLTIRGRIKADLAFIGRDGLDSILRDYPVVALPLAAELASEVRTRNDQVRQILELTGSHLSKDQLDVAVRRRRQTAAMRGVAIRRLTIGGLFRRLVVEQGAEPPFWMLAGFLGALAGARLVVFLILKYHLEQQLFALVAGTDPNPMHIHHFNYGLLLAGSAGLAALFPLGRRSLRILAALFGIGCGLIFDEFALFWNLNPDYSQTLSVLSAGIVAIVLVQLTYFRKFWMAMIRRVAQKAEGE